MLLFSLECSAAAASAAIYRDEKLLGEEFLNVPQTHSVTLLPMAKSLLERGEIVQLHLREIIPARSICLVYDHHRPLNTAARKFQQMLAKPESKQADA